MAEAILALDAVARLHGLNIEETHVPFGGVAVAPCRTERARATRAAILGADAVLVAGAEEPALAEVMAELDLRAQVTRVRFGQHGDVAFVSPLAGRAGRVDGRAGVRDRRVRRVRLASVGDRPWSDVVDAVARHEHRASSISLRMAVPLAAFNAAGSTSSLSRRPGREAMVEIAGGSRRRARRGARPARGPRAEPFRRRRPDGGFALAGQGVVNPSSMLLAASMMLRQGLGAAGPARRSRAPSRRRSSTAPQTPDLLRRGIGATTREFTSRVVWGFQLSHDAEEAGAA